MDAIIEEDIKRASCIIQDADFLLIMAGAGMSAESGLKTYEEISKNCLDGSLEYADYCDPEMLEKNPEEFWKFWGHSAANYQQAQPHKGYTILKKWRDEKMTDTRKGHTAFFESFFEANYEKDSMKVVPTCCFVYSSNVDGLFLKSGFPPNELLEIHGNANELQCADGVECKGGEAERIWRFEEFSPLPRCPKCNKISRPYVLMFNDEAWLGLEGLGSSNFDLYDVWEEGMEKYMRMNHSSKLVILEVGCGDRVPVVKMESETVLGDVCNLLNEEDRKNRVHLIRINVDGMRYLDYHKEWSDGNSHIDPDCIICLQGECGSILERIDKVMCEKRSV